MPSPSRDRAIADIVREAKESLSLDAADGLDELVSAFPECDIVMLVTLLAAKVEYHKRREVSLSSAGYARDARGYIKTPLPKPRVEQVDSGETWLQTGVTSE